MNWIAMEDQLPPTDTPILICASDGTICVAEFEYNAQDDWIWWNGVGFSGYEWDWDWECRSEPWKGVTHWMPLPEAPNAALRGDSGLIAGVPLESTVMQQETK